MHEKYDRRAFGVGMTYPPKHATNRINSIKANKMLLKQGYNARSLSSTLTGKSDNMVTVKVLGKIYEETMYESHMYTLIIKRLLSLHLNLKPIIKYQDTETTVPADLWGKYGQALTDALSQGFGYLYVYSKENQIKFNLIPYESVCKVYEDGELIEYVVGDYIYAVEDIFKEGEPTQLKLTHIGQGYVEENLYTYDAEKKKIGTKLSETVRHTTNIHGFNLIEFRNGFNGESDFDQYRQSVILYEKAVTSVNLLLQVGLSPVVEVPMGTLIQGVDGTMQSPLTPGGIIENTGQNPIKTVGLDLKIEDLQNHKERLFNDIAVQTELGALLKADFGGSNISADGLQIMLKSALDKSSRICDYMDSSMKNLVSVILQLQGNTAVKTDDIEIIWRDGINKIASEEEVQE